MGKHLRTVERLQTLVLDLASLSLWFIVIEIITKLSHFKVMRFSKTLGFCVCAYNMDQMCWSIKSNVPGNLLLSQN